MSGVNLAVLGATGVVGNEILKILAESSIPINNLKLLSSPKSAGKKITFKGKEYTVQNTTDEVFGDVDIVLASAGASTSRTYVEAIKKATRTTFRYGKYGEGLICCKIKRYDDESMDNIVICRGEKCIHIHNLDNKSEYSIRIQSEESKRLITFLRTFYHDDKLFAY